MEAHPDIDVALDKPGKASQLGINHTKFPTSERKFRQGIQYALNTAEFMAALGPEELWTTCATAFHCGTPLESHEGDDRYNQHNLELAKKLIEESGYDGEPLTHMNPNDYGTITPLGPVFKKQMGGGRSEHRAARHGLGYAHIAHRGPRILALLQHLGRILRHP